MDSWIATWNIILCFHWKPSYWKGFCNTKCVSNLTCYKCVLCLIINQDIALMFVCYTNLQYVHIHKKDSHLVCTMTNVLLFYLGWKCIAICQEYEVITQHFCACCLYTVYITKGLVLFLAIVIQAALILQSTWQKYLSLVGCI